MKRVITITILTLLTLALCGCVKAEADNRRLWVLDASPRYYEIYVDNLTGVQYLRTYKRRVCNGRRRGKTTNMGRRKMITIHNNEEPLHKLAKEK